MKKYILLFIFSISLLVSCTSNQTEMPDDTGESIEEKEDKNNNEENKKEESSNTSKEISVETNEKLIEMEGKMLELINKERKENDLNTLKFNDNLRNLARVKSKDIAENDYFSHTSPTYGTPFEMMKEFGISFRKAAENLAGDRSVKSAHKGLMNSKGHRKNILDPAFNEIGIGIKKDDKYGYIFTQMFLTKNK